MDAYSLLRTFGGLLFVLALLCGALWLVRRYDIRLPGRVGGRASKRRIEIIERVAIDQRRAIILIRRDGCEHLLLISPEGHVVVDQAARGTSFETALALAPTDTAPPHLTLMAKAIELLWRRVSEDARSPVTRRLTSEDWSHARG